MTTPPLRLAIVDYGMGNRRSVQKAFEHVGAPAAITRDLEEIRAADGVIVPGVGAFPRAMENLSALGLDAVIRERAGAGTPTLGICLGMQLLFETSVEHADTSGLGLIEGDIRWLDGGGLRIPHIGWNEVAFERPSPLTAGLPAGGAPFYHVHSLAAHPRDPAHIVARTEYGERFATIVAAGTVFGVQFHPEKSSTHGLRMVRNFVEVCASTRADLRETARAA